MPLTGAWSPGVVLLVLVAMTSTWTSIRFAGQSVSDVVLVAALAVCVVQVLSRRAPVGLRYAGGWVALWCILVSLLLVTGDDDFARDVSLAFGLVASVVVFPVVVLILVRTIRDARAVLCALVVSGGINGAAACLYFGANVNVSPDQERWSSFLSIATSRAVGLTGHPNVLGYVAAVTIPLVPGLMVVSSRSMRWLLALCAATTFGGLLLSGSRGGALGVVVGVAYVTLVQSRRLMPRARRWVVAVTLGTLAFLVVAPGFSLVSRALGDTSAAEANATRVANLSRALDLIWSAFPNGNGFDQLITVHSGLLALVAAGGPILAFGLAVWAFGVGRAAREASRTADDETPSIIQGCVASCVGTLAFLATSPLIYHRYALIPPAIILAIAQMLRQAGADPTRRNQLWTSTSPRLSVEGRGRLVGGRRGAPERPS